MGSALTVVQKRPVEVAVGVTALITVGVIVYEALKPRPVFRSPDGRTVTMEGPLDSNLERLKTAIQAASAEDTFTATEALRLDSEFTRAAKANAAGALVLDFEGFRNIMKRIGIRDAALIKGLFKQWDVDGSGELDFTEFLHSIALVLSGRPEDKLEQLFWVMDTDGNGRISAAELSAFFTNMFRMTAAPKTPAQVQELVVKLFARQRKDASFDTLNMQEFMALAQDAKFVAGESLQEFMVDVAERFAKGLRGANLPRVDSTLPAPAAGVTPRALSGSWAATGGAAAAPAPAPVPAAAAAQDEGLDIPPPPGGAVLARQSSRDD